MFANLAIVVFGASRKAKSFLHVCRTQDIVSVSLTFYIGVILDADQISGLSRDVTFGGLTSIEMKRLGFCQRSVV